MLHCLEQKLLQFQTRNTTSAWIHDQVTVFADDFLAMFRLRTVEDLSTMCVQIGCLFTVLHEAGVQINPEKSQLLIQAAGSTLNRWIRMRTNTVEGSCSWARLLGPCQFVQSNALSTLR